MKFIGKITGSPRLFNGISWGVTALVVISLLGFTLGRILPANATPVLQTTPIAAGSGTISLPGMSGSGNDPSAIVRKVSLGTSADTSIQYTVVQYKVKPGDTVSSIAAAYKIKSTTLMWANGQLMQNGPNSLKVGQVLLVPPVDGVLYKWKTGDTLNSVADQFGAAVDDILLWPGNNIDLTNPGIDPNAYVMIPGGTSDAIDWVSVAYASGLSGTSVGTSTSCGNGGPVGGGGTLMWPSPYHYINGGNQFGPNHLAIDLYAPEGTPISAADNGVVVWASYGAWNGGYGNVIMIDHRDGFRTLYAHLSQVNVSLCQGVYAGQIIGLSGNTGNSSGAHLHFEVRQGGGFMNPWDYLPAP
ncbi:MAG TPA: M23 family metallopeptidase [Anaerolineales bacterium]